MPNIAAILAKAILRQRRSPSNGGLSLPVLSFPQCKQVKRWFNMVLLQGLSARIQARG